MMRHMQTNGDRPTTGRPTGQSSRQRHSIPQAAKALGLTEEAVRQRVKRGTLDSIKVEGKLFVLLDTDRSEVSSSAPEQPVNDTSKDRSNDRSNDRSMKSLIYGGNSIKQTSAIGKIDASSPG